MFSMDPSYAETSVLKLVFVYVAMAVAGFWLPLFRSRSRSDPSSVCGLISNFSYLYLFSGVCCREFHRSGLFSGMVMMLSLSLWKICSSSYDLLVPKLVMFLGVGVVVNAFLLLLPIFFSCR